MNLQAQMTGQLSWQVPNQPGFSLPGVPQHGESSVSTHMQNPAAQRNMQLTEKARKFMIIKIHEFLAQRLQHAYEMPPKRLLDITRRLEQLLYNNAASKEGYMNLATLENRLQVLIQRIPMSNQQQQFSHANSSSSVGTMIPTPGMTQTGTVSLAGTGNGSVVNQMITGNGSNNNVAATINSGSFSQSSSGLPVGVYSGSFNSSDGTDVLMQSHQQFQRSHESQTVELSQHQQRQKQQSHQVPEQFQFSEMQNQYLQNSLEDHATEENFLSFPSGPKAAEDAAKAAAKRAEDVAADAQAKIESAIADYKQSDALREPIMASYDQGLYHMARCHQRAADQGKTPTLRDLAEFTQENSFCEELVHYHPVMPFSEEEIAEYNEGRRKDGLPELEFPPVVVPNMRAFQQELEAKRKEAESAAAQAEDAVLQTGDVAQQTEDAAA